MINYTERLTLLMQDIVSRVPTLSFINMADVLVFARSGRSNAEGAFATCHCLTLPASEPGYYFWRDRTTHRLTRRSEWFVTKSPIVMLSGRPTKYMISFSLPRCYGTAMKRRARSPWRAASPDPGRETSYRLCACSQRWSADAADLCCDLFAAARLRTSFRLLTRRISSAIARLDGH